MISTFLALHFSLTVYWEARIVRWQYALSLSFPTIIWQWSSRHSRSLGPSSRGAPLCDTLGSRIHLQWWMSVGHILCGEERRGGGRRTHSLDIHGEIALRLGKCSSVVGGCMRVQRNAYVSHRHWHTGMIFDLWKLELTYAISATTYLVCRFFISAKYPQV